MTTGHAPAQHHKDGIQEILPYTINFKFIRGWVGKIDREGATLGGSRKYGSCHMWKTVMRYYSVYIPITTTPLHWKSYLMCIQTDRTTGGGGALLHVLGKSMSLDSNVY